MEALRYYRRVTDTFEIEVAFDEPVTGRPAARRRHVSGHLATRRSRQRLRGRGPAVVVATGAYDLPTSSVFLARICRMSRTTTGSRTRTIGAVSWWSEARTPRRKRRSSSSRLAPSPCSCIGARRWAIRIKYWVKPDIENRIKEGS